MQSNPEIKKMMVLSQEINIKIVKIKNKITLIQRLLRFQSENQSWILTAELSVQVAAPTLTRTGFA
jgi:hypothetical protein